LFLSELTEGNLVKEGDVGSETTYFMGLLGADFASCFRTYVPIDSGDIIPIFTCFALPAYLASHFDGSGVRQLLGGDVGSNATSS